MNTSAYLTDARQENRQLRWSIIPSPREWQAASATARFQLLDRRSSPEMRAIDQAVANYDRLALNSGTPTAQLWEAAVALLEAIEVYLASPRGHKQRRVDAVQDLRATTGATLTKLRWQKVRDIGGNAKPGMKTMVKEVWSEMHAPDHARVGHGEDALNDPDPWLRGEQGAHEKYLFQYLRRVRAVPNGEKPDNVRYIEDTDRWKYQVVFTPQGLAHERQADVTGQVLSTSSPITTKGGDLSTATYAIDEDGIFYTETSHHQGSINHCSYLQGRPVMCAGNIGITNGIVGYIDNGSGHYRPTLANLLRGLKALQDQVSPIYFDAILVRNHAGVHPSAAYLAGKFLRTNGKCLPVGRYQKLGFGTHYRHSLIEFGSNAELRDFVEGEDTAQLRARLEREMKRILSLAENSRVNGKLTGILASDEDRRVVKAVLQAGLPISEAYYANDQPLKDWIRNQSYGVAFNF